MNQKKPNRRLSIAALKKGVTTKKGKRAAKKVAKSVSTVLLTVFLIFLITALVLAGVGAVYVTQYAKGNAGELDLYTLKFDQSQTSIIYGYDENDAVVELARLHGTENRTWVDMDKIPLHLQEAFISIEDERFYQHQGVDWKRTAAAFANMFANMYDSAQGGSTITQQLIKNVTGDNEVTIIRKINEIFTALELERNYSKEVILNCYLNEVYLGSGAYGVQAAAETYFGKNVEDLNIAESATIAAITKYPYLLTPLINPDKNRDRMEYCLRKMFELGHISQSEYDEALAYPLVLTNSPEYLQQHAQGEEGENTEATDEVQSYYVDTVYESVVTDLRAKYNLTREEAIDKLLTGGLRIYSAIDMRVQAIVDDVFQNYDGVPLSDGTPYEELENKDDQLPQSALVIMEYDGRIAGISGGAGKKQGNLSLNRATQSQRSPGSAIKPLTIYAPAIEYDLVTWSSKIPDQPIRVAGAKGLWPRNYSNTYGPDMTVQKGVEVSINTLPARIVEEFGLTNSFKFLTEKLHFHNMDPVNDATHSGMATGGFTHGVTVLDMTAGFQIFGNGGVYNKPYCYYEVKDSKGELILSHEINPEQVIGSDSATVMNRLLQTVMTGSEGTGRSYGLSNQTVFGKSGTTSDAKDRYWMGGTPYYIAGCWYGYDMPQRIRSSTNPAARIWRAVMSEVHDGLERKSFPSSSGVSSLTYCVGSGKIAGPDCPLTASGWYKSSNIPSTCQGGVYCWANESRLDLVPSGLIPTTTEETTTAPPTTEPPPTIPPATVPPTIPNPTGGQNGHQNGQQ